MLITQVANSWWGTDWGVLAQHSEGVHKWKRAVSWKIQKSISLAFCNMPVVVLCKQLSDCVWEVWPEAVFLVLLGRWLWSGVCCPSAAPACTSWAAGLSKVLVWCPQSTEWPVLREPQGGRSCINGVYRHKVLGYIFFSPEPVMKGQWMTVLNWQRAGLDWK